MTFFNNYMRFDKRLIFMVLMIFTTRVLSMASIGSASADSCANYELLTHYSYDFGDVDINNDTITAVFLAKSTGSSPMIVVGGSTTCTCTRVTCLQDIVPPGDTLTIKVMYHPFVTGTFKQSAVVSTNTKPYNYIRVYISGNVVEGVQKESDGGE